MHDETHDTFALTYEAPAPEEDVLMSRLIDGVASDADRTRFETLADANPRLWRELACRQQDMTALRAEVMTATAVAASVDLPRRWFAPPSISWTMAMSGWAAMIIVMVSWAALALTPRVPDVRSPEEHFHAYLGAPYVLDMQPKVLEVSHVSDGRVAVRFVREVEEVLFVDPDGEWPVDEHGDLLRDLRKFRQQTARH